MQIRMDNDVSKGILSLALTANQSGVLVDAGGKGTCQIWPDTEALDSFFILPPGYR